jgi:hypothetical protein
VAAGETGLPAGAFEERTVEVHQTTEEPVVSKTAHIAEEVVVRKMSPNARRQCATMYAGKRSMCRTLNDAVHRRVEGMEFPPPQTCSV